MSTYSTTSISKMLRHMPPEVIDFYINYIGLWSTWQPLLGLEKADFLQTLWLLHADRDLTLGALCKHFGMRQIKTKIGKKWLPHSIPPAFCFEVESLVESGFEPVEMTPDRAEIEVPVGLVANSKEFANRTRKGLRNAQIQIKKQSNQLVAYCNGRPDGRGQFGLFGLGWGEV